MGQLPETCYAHPLTLHPRLFNRLSQIVEKPQGLSGKSSPYGESEAEGFSEGKPEGAARGFAFGISRGIQILPRGNFFQISPKAFPQSVRLWFPRGARTFIPLEKFGKAAVSAVHCKSQITLIGNQSLRLFYQV